MTEVLPAKSRPASTGAQTDAAAATDTPTSKPNSLVIWVVSTGMFMSQIDSTALTTSLPQIAESLGVEPLHLSFAITSYLISLAVFIPISGWIADRYGPRRVFCAAVAVFTFSSALCGLATSLPMMVAFRIMQGFGGALMTPVGRLILVRSFPREQLYAAMAASAMPALVAPAMGPIIGGLITTYISWHWIFYLNLPIGAFSIALALYAVRDFDVPPPGRFDFRGFIIAGVGLALLELTLENLGRHRLLPLPYVIGFGVVAVMLLTLYTFHALSRDNPVLDLKLLRLRTFRATTVSGSMCRMAMGAMPFMLPLMLQVGFGMAPLQSGLTTFITSCGSIGMKSIASRLARRFGFRNLLVYSGIGLGIMIGGISQFQPTTPHWFMLGYLLCYGLVRSVQFTNIQAMSYAELTKDNMSKGTSMASVVQQLSNSFGVAIAATILAIVAGGSVDITAHDFHIAFFILGTFPIISAIGFMRLKATDGAEMAGNRRGRGGS
jgi:EmrB/QacA subfamily drug resistance transporter